MSWTAPRTWVANEVVTAAIMNTHVRDNLLATVPALVTTAGDSVYATAANTLARLAAVAYRMARANAAGNALEYIAGLNLAQAPVFASANAINSGTSFTDILTQSFTTHGGLVIAIANYTMNEVKTGANTDYIHNFNILRGAVSLDSKTIQGRAAGGGGAGSAVLSDASLIWMETPAAATYTYHLQASYVNLSTSGTPTAYGRLLLLELAP